MDLEQLAIYPAAAAAGTSAAPPTLDLPAAVSCPHCGGSVPLKRFIGESAGKPTILLVDDKDFFRDYAREILGSGYTYLTAASTGEALEKISSCDLDLIILDLNLENGPRDGHDILTRRSRKDTPVLVLTGERNFNIHSADWLELERLGARDIIEKGVNIREHLIKKVKRLLGEA
jgi:CheY-like chemotaxis protein